MIRIFIYGIALFLFSCTKDVEIKPPILKLKFENTFKGQPVVLGLNRYLTDDNDSISISTCKYFIGKVSLYNSKSKLWEQVSEIPFLVDEELGKTSFEFSIAKVKQFDSIAFTVGIDSLTFRTLNRTGDFSSNSDMFWHWENIFANFKLHGKSIENQKVKYTIVYHIIGYDQVKTQKLAIQNNLSNEFVVRTNIDKVFSGIQIKDYNNVISGTQASVISNNYSHMLSIE